MISNQTISLTAMRNAVLAWQN